MDYLNFIGLDIGKKTIDVAIPVKDGFTHRRINNTKAGFEALHTELLKLQTTAQKKKDSLQFHIVSEATGIYYVPIHEYFVGKGYKFTVLNPLIIKEFRKTWLKDHKDDKQDCILIAQYGKLYKGHKIMNPTPIMSLPTRQLSQLMIMRRIIQKKMFMLGSAAENMNFAPLEVSLAQKHLETLTQENTLKLEQIEKEMIAYVKKLYPEQYKVMKSIPSVGDSMILEIVCETDNLRMFKNLQQFRAYAGICPREYESGSSVYKKPKLSQFANRNLRRGLYLCAWNAKRYNPEAKALWERLPQHLSPNAKYMHLAKKIAVQIWHCVRNLETYKPQAERLKKEAPQTLRNVPSEQLINAFESGHSV